MLKLQKIMRDYSSTVLGLIASVIRQYCDDKRGSIAVQTALLLGILLGFAALALEITGLFLQQRKMQTATDAAVMAAAVPGRTAAQASGDAVAIAGDYGFAHGSLGVNVTVSTISPGTNYPYGGTAVILEKSFRPALLSLFISDPIPVRARSVSAISVGSVGCILALDTAGAAAISIENNASIQNSDCEIASNSTSQQALTMANNTSLAGPVFLVGNYSPETANITGRPLIVNGQPAVADPYASVTLPSAGACTAQSGSIANNSAVSLSPGRFCSGLTLGRNARVTLSDGVYFVQGTLTLGNNSSIVGSNATLIVNTATTTVFGNNSSISLTAPLTGATAGLAIASQRNVTGEFRIPNGATLNVSGAIYLPAMTANLSGQANTAGQQCTQLIAFRLVLGASVGFAANCGGTAVKPIGSLKPSLAE